MKYKHISKDHMPGWHHHGCFIIVLLRWLPSRPIYKCMGSGRQRRIKVM